MESWTRSDRWGLRGGLPLGGTLLAVLTVVAPPRDGSAAVEAVGPVASRTTRTRHGPANVTAADQAGPGGASELGGPCVPESQTDFASTASADDHFGTSVAIDGNFMAVGAEWDSPAGFRSGSAFVFSNVGGAAAGMFDFVQVQHIIASDPGSLDYFGSSIDLRGNRLIVGADGNDTQRGAAYLYQSGPFWAPQIKLIASDRSPLDHFGWSVGIDGDVAVVGAPGADEAGIDAGAAYVYRRSPDGIWQESQKFIASDAAPGDEFGHSIAVSGDIMVVGTGGTPGLLGDSVHVFRYMDIGDFWLPVQVLTGGDRFGWSVALRGDVLIVGSQSNGAAAHAGGAAIFRWQGDLFAEEAPLSPCDGSVNLFGWSVDIDGDRAVVGAFGDTEMAGAAYFYERIGTRWGERAKIHPPEPIAPGMMGYDVAMARPIVFQPLMAAGAPFDPGAAPGAGAVHAFLLCPPCSADTNADATVDVLDLVGVILQWGPCSGPCCHADINGDSMVDVVDLVELVLAWGPC